MSSIKKLLLSSLLLLLILPIQLLANGEPHSFTYQRTFPTPPNCTQNFGGQRATAGAITTFFAKYAALDEQLTLDVTLERCAVNGALANGFWIVLNSGPNPKGHAGELAILYADYREPTKPVVTVYGYNGVASSYYDGFRNDDHNGVSGMPGQQEPDRIASSLVDNSFVLDAGVTNPTPDTRRFQLKISVVEINDHSPRWPVAGVQWDGIHFNQRMGIWFHPAELNSNTTYCSRDDLVAPCNNPTKNAGTGFLKKWAFNFKGHFDGNNLATNSSPSCSVKVGGQGVAYNSTEQCYEVSVGDNIEGAIHMEDEEGDTFLVDYQSHLPASARLTPPGPREKFSGKGTVTLDWTPQIENQGQRYPLWLFATDEHGADAECGIDTCVRPNSPPTCQVSFTDPEPNKCDGTVTTISFSSAGTTDPDGDPLTYDWSTDCQEAELELENGQQDSQAGAIRLTAPGKGVAVSNCSITLKATDSHGQATACELPVSVLACSLDCLSQPNGAALLDACGVCNGDNSTCTDCAGVVNGNSVVDVCGKCGGDGKDCLDCNGEVNGSAKIDQCGECGGDGLSCANCEQVDVKGLQFSADGRVADLARVIRQEVISRALRINRKINGKTRQGLRNWARAVRETVHNTRKEAWVAIWSINSIQTTCNEFANNLCVSVSNVSALSTYTSGITDLELIAEMSLKRLERQAMRYYRSMGLSQQASLQRTKRLSRELEAKVDDFASQALEAANSIPVDSYNCDG